MSMLVLARFEKQKIYIGDDITIKVMRIAEVDGKFLVELGIEAPKDIPILRDDIVKHKRTGGNK